MSPESQDFKGGRRQLGLMQNFSSPEQQARHWAALGQYREALDILHVALQQDPTHETWALWARLQLNLGNPEQAVEGYRRALNLNPAESAYEVCLDDLWTRDRARREAGDLIERGRKLLQMGHGADAAPVLQAALRRHETAELWNDWGCAEFLQGHRLEAEGGFRRALAMDPAHVAAAGNLGLLLHQMGRHQEALPWLERARAQAALQERPAWNQVVGACEAAVREQGAAGPASNWMAETTATLSRLKSTIENLQSGLQDIRKLLPKPSSPTDESHDPRTLLERVPVGKIIGTDTCVRLIDPATSSDPLPLVDRWLLGTLAALAASGPMLCWGPKNAVCLDLAANAKEGSTIWHVADAVPGFDPLEPSRLDPVRSKLQARIWALPVHSPGFNLSDWIGRMSLVVIESNGTVDQVRDYTRSAMPFLAEQGSVAVWFGYGQWKGVTWALNELFLSQPGFESMIHIAESNLAVLVRPAAA